MAEERARIARELHDVVAHAISVVVVQARGGRKVVDDDPRRPATAFGAIEQTQQALGEMRRLLGMLRDDDEERSRARSPPSSGWRSWSRSARSGLPVDVAVDGRPGRIPPGVDLSGYRIVQEALTNVLKHAGPAVARVDVRYGADDVEVAVIDTARRPTGPGRARPDRHPGAGRGRRRRVEAGPQPDGGFAVRARLPYRDDA